jgi:hypothetical protein
VAESQDDIAAFERNRKRIEDLKARLHARELANLNKAEANILSTYDMEERLGGRVNTGKEITDVILNAKIGGYEDVGDALNYANTSGRLPEGAKAYGVTDNQGGTNLLYNQPGSNEFNYINDPGLSKADIGTALGPLASFETLSAFAPIPSKFAAGAKALKHGGRIARAGWESAMAGTGRVADEILEGLAVDNVDDFETLRDEALQSGILALPFSFIGQPMTPKQLGKERPISPDDVASVIAAETRQAYQPLGAGEFGSPVGERVQAQAAGVSPKAAARELEKLTKPARKLIAEAAGIENIESLDDAALLAVVSQEERVSKRLLQNLLKGEGYSFKSTGAEKGGESVYDAVTAYRTATSLRGEKNFSRIFDIAEEEGISFDVTGVISAAEEATEKARLLMRGQPAPEPSLTDVATGFTPQATGPEFKEIPTLLDPQLESVLRELTSLEGIQPTEALRGLRTISTRLRGLADPDPGSLTRTPSQKAANDVLLAINEAANKGVGSPKYKAAVDFANGEWRERSQNLKAFGFMEDLSDELGGGEKIYEKLVSGEMPVQVARFLKKQMTNKQENDFLNAFYTTMLRNPDQITPSLKSMDVAGHILIPKAHRQALTNYSREVAKSNSSLLAKLVMQQGDDANRLFEILERGDPLELVRLKRGGIMSQKQIKESVFYKFVEASIKFENGQQVLDPRKYERVYKKFEKEGWLKLLDSSQRRILADTRLYASYLKVGNDAGNSLESAALASQMAQSIAKPIKGAKARLGAYQLAWLSRMSHNPVVRSAMAGGTFKAKDHRWKRAALVGSTLYLRQVSATPEIEKKDTVRNWGREI